MPAEPSRVRFPAGPVEELLVLVQRTPDARGHPLGRAGLVYSALHVRGQVLGKFGATPTLPSQL